VRFSSLLLLLTIGLHAENYRSFGTSVGSSGSKTLPNSAPFNSVGTLRIEYRLHANTATGAIGGVGNVTMDVTATSPLTLRTVNNYDAAWSITHSAGTGDVLVRIQRNATTERFSQEIWSATGEYLISGFLDKRATGPANLSVASTYVDGGNVGKVAWLRVYNTAVELDSAPPSNTAEASPLLNYEFEGNLNDSSANAQHFTPGGSPAYSNTPVVPLLGDPRTVRAGQSFTVDCGATAASSYFWQQLSGPLTVTWSDRTAATPTVTGADAFGEYQFQCQATYATSGLVALGTVKIGAVPTNAAGVVVQPNERIEHILGPLFRGDASPWPFYDKWRRRRGISVFASQVATRQAQVTTPLAGTVSINNGSTTLNGVGTSFTTTMTADNYVIIYYDKGGGNIGRVWRYISSIQSDTQLTVSPSWNRPNQSGIQHQYMSGTIAQQWSDGWNYYDACLALYGTYYKTGLLQFAEMADAFSQLWFLHADGVAMAPRQISLDGLLIAAERGAVNTADAYALVNTLVQGGYDTWLGPSTSETLQNLLETREMAYVWRNATSLARLHPTAETRTLWSDRLVAHIQNVLRDFQCKTSNPDTGEWCRTPNGAYRWKHAAWDNKLAEQPWITGLFMHGVWRWHRWTGNATANTVLTEWVNHLMTNTQPDGQGPDDELWLGNVDYGVAPYKCDGHYYWHLVGGRNTLDATGGFVGCETGTSNMDALYVTRDYNYEIQGTYGYAYRLTGTAAIKTRADTMFGRSYGASDGFHGTWAQIGANNAERIHNQALVHGDSYLVDRLPSADASTAPVSRSISVSGNLASVLNATQLRITVTLPNGATSTNTCTASSCAVTGDAQQGQHRYVVEFLSAGDAVLARSDPQIVTP